MKVLLRGIAFCLFFLSTTLVRGQIPSDYWHIGTLYLSEGDSLKGLLKYNIQEEYVMMKSGKKEFSFNPMQFDAFWIIDINDSTRRDFKVFRFKNREGLERPEVFEVLVTNSKFSILVRERIEFQNQSSFMNQGFAPTRSIKYDYFFMEGNIIRPFVDTKKKVIQLTKNKEEEILAYAKQNKLRFYYKSDLKTIFEYYYTLIEDVEENSSIE